MSLVRFWSAVIGAGTGILFVIVLLVHAALRSVARTSALYRKHVADAARERAFLASAAFFVTVVSVRLITLSIHLGLGGFRDISVAGTHVHHLVWGILLLLIIGYLWLLRIGAGDTRSAAWASRLTAVLYGVGSGLTLDEFALWLRLEDVYWSREGRESIEAVILFGGLLSVGLWGGRFFHALARDSMRRSDCERTSHKRARTS